MSNPNGMTWSHTVLGFLYPKTNESTYFNTSYRTDVLVQTRFLQRIRVFARAVLTSPTQTAFTPS
jgi:hypothetical protein